MNEPANADSGFFSRLQERAGRPVALDSIAVFRVAFGAILFWEVVRFFLNGWIEGVYIDPPFHFTYAGFSWGKPLPAAAMYLFFFGLGLASALVCLGLFYRVAIVVVFLGFTYVFLLEKAVYLNHAYLICLVSFLMMFLPAAGMYSFDARQHPRLRRETVPAIGLWILRFQIALPYVFGGIAKITPDWLHGQPMQIWLMELSRDYPKIPGLDTRGMAIFFSYGGLLFDLFVVPALFWKRTRALAFVVMLLFHLTNAFVFHIGVFPWLMIFATTLFLPPTWPKRWFQKDGSSTNTRLTKNSRAAEKPSAVSKPVLALAAIWCLLHVLVPLRHWLYPGDVSWTEEGYRFSWRMMLNEKLTAIEIVYELPQTGQMTRLVPNRPPRPELRLTPQQIQRISIYPDMLHEYALALSQAVDPDGKAVVVRALVYCSLNGRRPQLFVDPSANLAKEPRLWETFAWIVPLEEPLPEKPWLIHPTKWEELDFSEAKRRLMRPPTGEE